MKPATCCISTEVFILNEEFPMGVSHWYSKPSINQTSIFRMYKSDSFRALDTSVYQIKIWNIRCVSGQCQDGCCKSVKDLVCSQEFSESRPRHFKTKAACLTSLLNPHWHMARGMQLLIGLFILLYIHTGNS